jgi:hypothetical protein
VGGNKKAQQNAQNSRTSGKQNAGHGGPALNARRASPARAGGSPTPAGSR